MSETNIPASTPPVRANHSEEAEAIEALKEHYQRLGSAQTVRPGTAVINVTMGPVTVHATGAVTPSLPTDFGTLVNEAVITTIRSTDEGILIRSVHIPLLAIINRIRRDPSLMYEINPRKWEEIVAASYDSSGFFDEVTLTPRSGDFGRDLIAVKNGFGSVRIVESVKRYKPGHRVPAKEVRELLGVVAASPSTSKGVISTTWEFAPEVLNDEGLRNCVPTRIELVNKTLLVARLTEYVAAGKK